MSRAEDQKRIDEVTKKLLGDLTGKKIRYGTEEYVVIGRASFDFLWWVQSRTGAHTTFTDTTIIKCLIDDT